MSQMPSARSAADGSSEPAGAALISRDPDAFEAFYREHVDALQRFIARRVASPEAAADLTADVFLAAIEAAASYDPSCGPPKAWLFGIARHRIADSYRSAARESRATAAVVGSALLDADDLSRIHDRLDAESAAREIYRQLDQIPEPERAVLELVALDELSLVEVAAVLKITKVAARVRLHRARRRLVSADPDPSRASAKGPTKLDMLMAEPQA